MALHLRNCEERGLGQKRGSSRRQRVRETEREKERERERERENVPETF